MLEKSQLLLSYFRKERESDSLSPAKPALSPSPVPSTRGPQRGAGAHFPVAVAAAAAARAVGCPHQLPLPLSSLLALGAEPASPSHLPSARWATWAWLPSQDPEVGTGGPWKLEQRGWGCAGGHPQHPLFFSGCNGPAPSDSTPRWDPCQWQSRLSGSASLASPHHALSHHPVTEALLTAASHLGEKTAS